MRTATARGYAFFAHPFINSAPRLVRQARWVRASRGDVKQSTAAACCISEQVLVRRAHRADIGGAVGVLSHAFAHEEGQASRTIHSPIGRVLGARRALRLVEWFSMIEFWLQLNSRIRANSRDARGTAHAVLVAIERETGNVIGCVEMGAVNAKIAMKDGIEDQISAWSQKDIRCSGEVYMGNLAVKNSWRGRGVGAKLVHSVMQEARNWWDARVVWAHVADDNTKAKRLYRRLGFDCAAQEPQWYSEIGRERRLFLFRDTDAVLDEDAEAGDWDAARVTTLRKMNVVEYLRYCLYDLRRTRQRNEQQSARRDGR